MCTLLSVVGLAVNEEMPFDIPSVNESFANAYSCLVHREPITCAGTGLAVNSPDIIPDAALVDVRFLVIT